MHADSIAGSPESTLNDRFDLVFARLLLLHLNEPVLALRKMYNQVKPGGRILVEDYYFRSLIAIRPPKLTLNSKRYSLACTRRRA